MDLTINQIGPIYSLIGNLKRLRLSFLESKQAYFCGDLA